MLGCTRTSLHGAHKAGSAARQDAPCPPHFTLTTSRDGAVVASEKGVVVGRLTFREDGDFIDCRRMGVGGKAIPPNIDKACRSVQRRAAEPLHMCLPAFNHQCGGALHVRLKGTPTTHPHACPGV